MLSPGVKLHLEAGQIHLEQRAFDPGTLRQRWWQSSGKKGKDASKRFEVAAGSREFELVEAIFKAEPMLKRYYPMKSTSTMKVKRVERIENGQQQESFDSSRANVKNEIEHALGAGSFESGKHSRWLWHGAGDSEVLGKIVNSFTTGFKPLLNERFLWGKGLYFARD